MGRCLATALAVLAVLAVAVTGCGDDAMTSGSGTTAPTGGTSTTGPEATADPSGPATTGPEATTRTTHEPVASPFDDVVPTVAGGQLDLATLAGRDLIVWFWAPW